MALEVALLSRAEGLVEQHLGGPGGLSQGLDLVSLATAHEQGGIGSTALAGDAPYRLHASGLGQQAQFLQALVEMGFPEVYADQDGGRSG
jgi:hypothetical protein